LYRYSFDPIGGFTLDDSVSTSAAGFPDVEGVTVDTSGNIYVMAEGKKTTSVADRPDHSLPGAISGAN
jgi:uncharacterized protein YjiK